MRIPATSGLLATLCIAVAQVGMTLASVPTDSNYTAAQISSGYAFNNITLISAAHQKQTVGARTGATCTYANARVRKEWYDRPSQLLSAAC